MTVEEVIQHIKNTQKKIVIFDFDDTICDMEIDWPKWDEEVGKLLQKYDPAISLSGGYMRDNLMNGFLEKFGEAFRKEWRALSNQFEKENAKGCEPLTRIVTLIKQLENIDLWIWSSNSEEVVRTYLRDLEIENKFSTFITRDSVDYIKPSSDGFLKHAGNRNPNEFLFIGNAKNDRLAAEAAKIEYIDVKDIEN